MKKKYVPNMILKSERVKKGFSQTDMAKKLGIGLSSYVEKENGKRSFDVQEAALIARILEVSPTSLFFAS